MNPRIPPCLTPTGPATAKNTIIILGIVSTIKMYPSLNGKKSSCSLHIPFPYMVWKNTLFHTWKITIDIVGKVL